MIVKGLSQNLIVNIILILVTTLHCRLNTKEKNSERTSLKYKGVVVTHVHIREKGYGSHVSEKLYNHLKTIGVNSIQLNTFVYQKKISEVRLSWEDATLTNEDLSEEIKSIHRHKMSVMLKPHLWLGGWSNSTTREWRNQIDYKNNDKLNMWFQIYSLYILEQAKIAKKLKVEFFVIGTEFVSLTKHTANWKKLIKDIRKLGYAGKLGYSCEAWNMKNIHFWKDLDFIGINFYYGANKKGTNYIKFLSKKLKHHYYLASLLKKPLYITEIGYPSHELALKKPYAWPSKSKKANSKIQVEAYRYLYQAFSEAGFPEGAWFWKYITTLDSYESRYSEKGFNIQGKPAEQVLSDILKH